MSSKEHDMLAPHTVGVVQKLPGGEREVSSLELCLPPAAQLPLSLKKMTGGGGTHQCKAFEVKREQTINFRKMLMLIQTAVAASLTDRKEDGGRGLVMLGP